MDAPSYDAELDGTLPAGALLYLSFGDIEQNFDQALKSADEQSPEFRNQLEQLQQALGFDLRTTSSRSSPRRARSRSTTATASRRAGDPAGTAS